jgi:hypothetical protein
MNNRSMVVSDEHKLPAEQNGSLAVSLARAEVDQQVTTARAYPRSIARSVEHILTLATLDETAASECIYALKRDNKLIKGPSIRLAEIIASQWGNCRVGARVVHVDRFEKYVEAEGIFHDLETNMATTARIRRRISTKAGGTFSEDMIVVTGNAACAIAKRNAILGGVPRGVWRKAYDALEHVINGDVKTLVSRRRSAIATFAAEFKITAEQIFQALEIGGEEDIDLEKLSLLTAMRSSLKNGEATVEELFPKLQPSNVATKGDPLDALAAGGGPRVATGEEFRWAMEREEDPRVAAANFPRHDPDTGEIISDEMAKNAQERTTEANAEREDWKIDPTGEKAAAQLASRLDERKVAVERATADALDIGTQRLLDDARARVKNGMGVFSRWHRVLSKEHRDQLAPYLRELHAEANAADAVRAST